MRRSQNPLVGRDNSMMKDHFILPLLKYLCLKRSLMTFFLQIFSVLFVTWKCRALSDITLFDFSHAATNLLNVKKNCSHIMSSTSSTCIALTIMQTNINICNHSQNIGGKLQFSYEIVHYGKSSVYVFQQMLICISNIFNSGGGLNQAIVL